MLTDFPCQKKVANERLFDLKMSESIKGEHVVFSFDFSFCYFVSVIKLSAPANPFFLSLSPSPIN